MKYIALTVLLSGVLGFASGQENSVFPSPFQLLTPVSELPETVMYTKSMVLVDAPRVISKDATWQTFAEEAHQVFQEAGIDAVAYYHWQDARAGRDVSRLLTEQLQKREIKNVILLSYAPPQRSSHRYGLLITSFNEKASLVSPDQSAYMMTGNDWGGILDQFGKFVLRNRYETQNFLISDFPEFFTGAGNVVKGRRAEGFAQDLKLDKLAVPRLVEDDVPAPQLASNDTALSLGNEDRLTQIMEAYPYEYGLVDPAAEEDQIRQEGYQFILLRLHSTEENLRTMLGYEDSGSEATEVEASTPVYKYYVKHIYTGDVYLGDVWDAAPTWEEALHNHLQHLRSDFNIGQ